MGDLSPAARAVLTAVTLKKYDQASQMTEDFVLLLRRAVEALSE